MTITGTIPNVIASLLKKENQSLNGIEIKGNDIDVVLVDDGIYTELYAIGMGNGTFEIIELEDNLNLLPEYDVGDVVSNDVLRKLFYTVINSSLILSFNPLGEVKYGIKDKIANLKEKTQKVKDWANNTLYAEDAEKWIRGNGPYRRTFTDARDGQTRTKKDYTASRINVGKIQQLTDEGKGHYKVLSGNPATQDFQVWHLYKNGNKIRCLDVKTGLKAQEAQWVYDNNIPDSWSEADWNPEGEIPEKASKIEIGETQEQKNQTEESQTEETTEEDNVEEGEMEQTNEDIIETEEVQETNETEEDNVTEIDDMDPDTWFEEDNTHEAVTEEEDNVIEEPKNTDTMGNNLSKKEKYKKVASLYKDVPAFEDISEEQLDDYLSKLETAGSKKKKKVAASFIKSSIEDSDSDFGEDIEEDNVIESEPKKKSKYNGCNVTGCVEGDGTVALASELIRSCLLINNLVDFQNKIKQYKLSKITRNFLTDILGKLIKLPADVRQTITEDSNDNVLMINFGKTDLTTENYIAQFEVNAENVLASINLGKGNKIEGDDAIKMCKQTLDSIINKKD